MELKELVAAVRRRWYVVAVLTALGLVTGFVLGTLQKPQYRATSSLLVTLSAPSTVDDLSKGALYIHDAMGTLEAMGTSAAVVGPVINALRLSETPEDVVRRVAVIAQPRTAVLDVAVVDPDAQEAANIARAISSQFAREVQLFSRTQTSRTRPPVLRAVEIAPVGSSAPVPISLRGRVVVLGALGGLVLGFGAAVLIASLGAAPGSRSQSIGSRAGDEVG